MHLLLARSRTRTVGQIDALFGVGFISYHLIEFSREALLGNQNASFYSARARETIDL
jgi:hopanoid C-2 methylase